MTLSNLREIAAVFNIELISAVSSELLPELRVFLPGLRSAVVCAQPYFTDDPLPEEPLYGLIAPFARRNYYKELRKKIEKLSSFLRRECGGGAYISVNSSLPEKRLAALSGIGFYGKHSIIINPFYASYIVLGVLLTTLEIKGGTPLESSCGECSLCMRLCPTGAITSPGCVERERCLQYISQQSGVGMEYFSVWGNRLYGCSLCQDICPLNKKRIRRSDFPIYGNIGPAHYLPDLIYLSDSEIKERFRGSQLAASWIPPVAIVKNALLAIAASSSKIKKDILADFFIRGRKELRSLSKKLLDNLN